MLLLSQLPAANHVPCVWHSIPLCGVDCGTSTPALLSLQVGVATDLTCVCECAVPCPCSACFNEVAAYCSILSAGIWSLPVSLQCRLV